MTISLLLYDDERAHSFEPLTTTRPLGELAAGIATIRERWEDVLHARADGFISRPHLVEFDEERAPAFHAGEIPAGCILVNSRFVPALHDDREGGGILAEDADTWVAAGRVAAIRLRNPINARELTSGTTKLDKMDAAGRRTVEITGVWLESLWDLVRYLPAQLSSDINCVNAAASGTSHTSLHCVPADLMPRARLREVASVLGDSPVLVASDAVIDPHVVFDARNGPIMVASHATIHSFTRLEGPCFIGEHSTVMQGRVAISSIGPHCKVSGEMSNTTMIGFANKAHDGFVGHSYLGRWVNIGAGTITSNLKNTYGAVGLWTPSGMRPTGMQFLGSFFGDHARTGIGTMLATGSVLGTASNVFGGEMPPRYVPPFSWGKGEKLERYNFEKFLEVAERVMSRRNVQLTDSVRRNLEEVHRFASTGRGGMTE